MRTMSTWQPLRLMCPDIPDPDYGNILFPEEDSIAPFELGTAAYYICKYGYAFMGGDSVRYCGLRPGEDVGVWNGTQPSCECKLMQSCQDYIFV